MPFSRRRLRRPSAAKMAAIFKYQGSPVMANRKVCSVIASAILISLSFGGTASARRCHWRCVCRCGPPHACPVQGEDVGLVGLVDRYISLRNNDQWDGAERVAKRAVALYPGEFAATWMVLQCRTLRELRNRPSADDGVSDEFSFSPEIEEAWRSLAKLHAEPPSDGRGSPR